MAETKGLKLEDVMAPQEPVEPEPVEKTKPEGDSLDTPSGHALDQVGLPNEEKADTDAERKRAVEYRKLKFIKRWLS